MSVRGAGPEGYALISDGFTTIDLNRVASPPPPPVESKRGVWAGRLSAAAGLAGFTALRVANYAVWANTVGVFGAGFCALSLVHVGLKGANAARFRQVASTYVGQVPFFFISQAYGNLKDDPATQSNLYDSLIALVGANVAIWAIWLRQKGAIRVESQPPQTSTGETFAKSKIVSHNVTHAIKLAAAGACLAGRFLSGDPIVKGLSSYGAGFFASQVAGERAVDLLDRCIPNNGKYRIPKGILLTLLHAATPITFIPWKALDSEERLRQLAFVGIAQGFSNGAIEHSAIKRIEQIRIEDLEEFNKLKPTQKPAHKVDKCGWARYIAYQVWRIGTPALFIGGMLGFSLWQESVDLKGVNPRIALGLMFTSFLGSYSLAKRVDSSWSPENRSPIKDWAMVNLWASRRILGVPPLLVFYALANSLKMDGDGIQTEQSQYNLAAVMIAWAAQGTSMGWELAITSSDRVGNPQLKAPNMLFADGAMTIASRVM